MRSMHPSFAPTHVRMSSSRPSRAFRGRSGSAMRARVMPTTSICPAAASWSAWIGSTIRLACRIGRAGAACLMAAARGTYTAVGKLMLGTAAEDRQEVHEPRRREAARDLGHVARAEAPGREFVAGDAGPDHEVASHLPPDRRQDLEGESHPVLEAAPVLVGALVEEGTPE